MQPLTDASSANIGDVLSDTAADSYKYCIARKAGECRAAALPGDIYVNCPNETKRDGGSYGCSWYSQNQDVPVDICRQHERVSELDRASGIQEERLYGSVGEDADQGTDEV
jgi:hypothetical protein